MEKIVEKSLRTVFGDDSIVFDKSRFAGGMTNYNYIMNIGGKEYVIRQPGNMTELMIDRKAEGVNRKVISDYGIDSNCIFLDSETGVKISEYIADAYNVAQLNPNNSENINYVTTLLKKVHQSNMNFSNVLSWEKELTKYEEIINMQQGSTFLNYPELKKRLFKFFEKYASNLDLVPCHNDTVPENFLVDKNKKAYLIDWEYSGMNDKTWDLAVYIMESSLEDHAVSFLMDSYYDGEKIPHSELMKIKSAMMAQDLLWSVWALIRHYTGEDFMDYYSLHYDRFQKNLNKLEKDWDFPLEEMVKRA